MINLSVKNGEIVADNGQYVASMERQPGETPLSPVERDEYAMLFATSPDLLMSLIKFIKAWNDEADPTTMTRLFNESCQAINKLMQNTNPYTL